MNGNALLLSRFSRLKGWVKLPIVKMKGPSPE